MNFAPTPAQGLLASSARAFLEKRCPPALAQEMVLDPRGFRDDLWQDAAALGWAGLLVPAGLGGSEGSMLDVMVLVEEMGRACFPGPYIPSAVVATAMLVEVAAREAGGGAGAARGRIEGLLVRMARGEQIATPAILEESGVLEPAAIAMRGAAPGRITGRKLFVKDAHLADALIVVVRSGAGFSRILIEPGRRGVCLEPMEAMSGEKLFAVALEEVETSASDLLGPPGCGWDALAPALQRGALARCAEMVGCAQRILEICVEHARVRSQSGRPIGSFQAIQHACADLLRDVEGARWIARQAAWKVEGGPAPAEVAMAKAHGGEACLRVARRAHQILGAIGYCEEHPLHLLHKRILAGSVDLGDATTHLETVALAIGLAPAD